MTTKSIAKKRFNIDQPDVAAVVGGLNPPILQWGADMSGSPTLDTPTYAWS